MGGSLQRRESVEKTLMLFDVEAVRRFNACGWLGYCLSLTTYDEEAAIEFTRTFDEGEASIWGLTVVAIEERITKVTRLPTVGEHYSSSHDARSARAQFTRPHDPQLDVMKTRMQEVVIAATIP